jgi:glycerate-2-kinase
VRCGANISEINAVRKHLSRIKGGWLARATGAATVLTLMISDVVGDDLATIGSGPTAPDPTTFMDAVAVLERYDLWEHVPNGVRLHLQAGVNGLVPETPKPGDACFARVQNIIIGNGATAVASAAATARSLRLEVVRRPEPVTGEAVAAGHCLGQALRELAATRRQACLLAAGEPTVTVRGAGVGGRTLELALGAAQELQGLANVALLACATDGEDGPSGAAGAIVDGYTMRRATALGLDAHQALRDNDTLPFFRALGDVIVTGPTGTNVADIYIGVVV